MEVWKDIPGYEGLYKVSSSGRVKSFWHKRPRILKSGICNSGYCLVVLVDKNHKKRSCRIHQLIADAFIPNPQSLPVINHIDGIKTNNDLSNIERCTYSENLKHAYDIGLRTGRGAKRNGKKIG